jgi:hypothetical protein
MSTRSATTFNGKWENASARRASRDIDNSSHSAIPAANNSSATQSRPATRISFSTIYSGFYDSSSAEVSNRVYSAAITTQPSAQLRPISFIRTTSAATKAPRLTNNGKMRLSETDKRFYPTSLLQRSTAKTLCAPTSGPTP